MESDPNQISQSPTLCRSGCGFYANAAFDGMCSMCYKETVKRKQAAPTGAPSSLVSEPISNFVPAASATSNVSAITAQASSPVEAHVEEARQEIPKVEVEPLVTPVAVSSVSQSEIVSAINDIELVAPKSSKKKKTRCEQCRANVGVISFPCRCGRIFCGTHRYAKEHNCTFDYKEHGAEEIRKNNPQIIGEKVQKI